MDSGGRISEFLENLELAGFIGRYVSVDKPNKKLFKTSRKKVETLPNPKQLTIEKVLITMAKPTKPLLNEGFLNRILTIEDIFGA